MLLFEVISSGVRRRVPLDGWFRLVLLQSKTMAGDITSMTRKGVSLFGWVTKSNTVGTIQSPPIFIFLFEMDTYFSLLKKSASVYL